MKARWTIAAMMGLLSCLVVPAAAWQASVQVSGGSQHGLGRDRVFACSDVQDTGTFYHAMRPYGTWISMPEHGWVWRPSVGASVQGWRPYCHNGRWEWTEYGWYWKSDYPWGWAAFHYGRWLLSGTHGWVWAPDVTWGPAWVTWRSSDSHLGWAPLPPGYVYRRGSGYYHHGRPVLVGHHWGLRHDHYVFVSHRKFLHRDVHRVAKYGSHGRGIYGRTRAVHHRYGHEDVGSYGIGLPRETVVRATGHRVDATPVVRRQTSMTLRQAARGSPFGTHRRTGRRTIATQPAVRREYVPSRTYVPREVAPARDTVPVEPPRGKSTSLKDLRRSPAPQSQPRPVPQRTVPPAARKASETHHSKAEVPPPPQGAAGKQTLRDLKNLR